MTNPKNNRALRAKRNAAAAMPRQVSLQSIDDLLAYSEHYANFTMRESGQLAPVFMILTATGSLLLLSASTADEQAKDESVMAARLVCIAYRATAVVFVAEGWMSSGLDASERPSEAPDRQEVVTLLGEAYERQKQKILPILRAESGSFSGFGDSCSFSSGETAGRFSRLIPPRPPTAEAQSIAKGALERMGVVAKRIASSGK